MIIYGRNPVKEAIKAGKTVEKVYLLKGERDPSLASVCRDAQNAGAIVTATDKIALDKLTAYGNHQGIAAAVTDFEYSSVDDIFAAAEEKGQPPLIVVSDGITDPHNLGAIIRSAECFGAHGVIIQKHRNVTVNDTVIKVSSGAAEHIPVAKVTNINDAIRELKERNVWVYAADFNGKTPKSVNLTGSIALVIGSEGDGIKRLTKELCDDTLTIPEYGKINSLNASVAAAVLMYEITRQRY